MNAHIVLEKVGIRLPNRVLFEDINWTLYEGMRVALAGRNGSGKSTLLKVMAGALDPTEGGRTVVGGKRLRVGFLDQSLLDRAVLESQHSVDQGTSAVSLLHARMMKNQKDDEPVEVEWEIRKILGGLGFNDEYMDGPMSRLSGGWLLRVFIAGALLDKPEVLLLDEPTNHLDISSIQWLEEFLQKEYQGSLVLVTHDVALQKRTTDALAILHGGRFYFRTHQSDYLTFRESLGDEKRILEKNIESIQKKIDENMEFVYKFRAKAQTAARAQGKLVAAQTMQAEQKELKDRLVRIEGFAYNLKFRFRLSGAGSKFPLSLKDVSFRYKETAPWILKNINIDVKRGARIAIIGDNGAGKTTLLNVMGDRLAAVEGQVMKGHGVETGFFGQHQLDELMLEDSVINNLRARAVGVSFEEVRGWLGAFGFGGDEDCEKKAKVLSGGERARLALLRILVTRINLCLLDEPTNHLDIETKDLLKEAIREFEGTIIMVSHDREFISDVADQIIYLSNDHVLTNHLGNLESFFQKYPQYSRHADGGKAKPSQAAQEKKEKAVNPALSFEERKKIKNQIKSLEKKVTAAEEEISKMGAEKDNVAASGDHNKLAIVEKVLNQKMIDWERMSSELEILRRKQSGEID